MIQKNKQQKNKSTLINTDVSNIFVVKNSKRRAFIEQFNYTSVNFTQKNLGTLLGFFIVRDNSPLSENIVNFLASEIKKNYFSPAQKPIEEKFESTLHHINRALEELANIGNVEWLGTIDGAVCALDHESIHFSITGNAHILLFRDNVLMNISDGLASPEASDYPLKTFVDISSGDLCVGDKIIITSKELFDLVSLEELQKNAIRMGQKNFIQFIETALTNECAIASATIIDVYENTHNSTATMPLETEAEIDHNFFGSSAGEKPLSDPLTIEEPINIDDLTSEPLGEYTDPRTGHIHMQGTDDLIEKPTFFESFSENAEDFFDTLKERSAKQKRALAKKISAITKNSSHINEEPIIDTTNINSSTHSENTYFDTLTDTPIEESPIVLDDTSPNNLIVTLNKILSHSRRYALLTRGMLKDFWHTCYTAISEIALKFKNPTQKTTLHFTDQEMYIDTDLPIQRAPVVKLLPNIHHITKLWHTMDSKIKMITIGIIAFMIFTPLVFAFFSSKKPSTTPQKEQPRTTVESTPQPPAAEPTPIVVTPKALVSQSLLQSDAIINMILLNDIRCGIEKKSITILGGGQTKKYPVPADAGNIAFATALEDLNMIFFITDTDKLYSFSPLSSTYIFQEKNPTFEHKKIIQIGTFMTYLYILQENSLSRHTRIENGFDTGKDWLKKPFVFSPNSSMAIGESIFTTSSDGKITRFTQGLQETFMQDSSVQKASLLYTTEDTQYLWVIDTQNGILYKLDKKDGKSTGSFTDDKFKNAKSLVVDEKTNTAFITSQNEIISFTLTN